MLNAIKKGMVVSYATDLSINLDNKYKAEIKAGTRALVKRAGANPVLYVGLKLNGQALCYSMPVRLAVRTFNEAEKVFTAGFEGYKVRNIKEHATRDGSYFCYEIYKGRTLVAIGENLGDGSPNTFSYFGDEGEKFKELIKTEIQTAKESKLAHHEHELFECFQEEHIVSFFVEGMHGFMTIQEYLKLHA